MDNASESSTFIPKNILVTGGAGFIGSHVCIYLVNKYPNYSVICLDSLESCASLQSLSSILPFSNSCNKSADTSPFSSSSSSASSSSSSSSSSSFTGQFRFVHGSIENSELLNHIFESYQIDTVLHFAAQSHVDKSFNNSVQFTKTNVLGTHILLEAARIANIKRFIHVSTDEVYGETVGEDPVLEEQLPNPSNPYACSKAAAELVVKSYINSFKMPIIITRSNNVYGPGQYPEKVVPKFILRLLNGEKCCLHGDGSSRRAYLHVADLCLAFDLILHQGKPFEIYNCGSPYETSILDLANFLVRTIKKCNSGEESSWIEFVEDRKLNDKRYAINSARLKKLGWSPTVAFEEGISSTIDWYKKFIIECSSTYWVDYKISLAPHPLEVAHKK